jgi:ATP-dependent helicase/nuclease subunit A
VFDLPSETFYAEDKVLGAHATAMEAEACYEQLAVLYVALTRAKRATYVITEPVGKSQSLNFPRLLQETLGEEWEAGDRYWFDKIEVAQPERKTEADLPVVDVRRTFRRPAHTPSDAQRNEVAGSRLFALEAGRAANFGKSVHELLAQVEWGGPDEIKRLAAAWREGGAAVQEALACLGARQLAEVWAKPHALAEVWRERAFEIVLDEVWVTGVFDRVVIWRDAGGRAHRAVVYDFKTDRGSKADLGLAAARHRGQLLLYRRAVAVLTGLPLSAVEAQLVFTEPAASMAVTGA